MRGLDIDTRSDIYSLGVLLYELLAGSTDETVKLWNAATGPQLMTLQEYKADLGTLRFSPDGTTLAAGRAQFSARERTVHLWRAPSFPEIDAARAQEIMEIRPQADLSGAVEESGRR